MCLAAIWLCRRSLLPAVTPTRGWRLVLVLAECAVERHGQRRLIAAEETRSRPGRQNTEMPAGSDGTRKSLAPAFGAGGGARNGDVPVGAHDVPVCAEDSMQMDGAGSGKWVLGKGFRQGQTS